MKFSIGLRVEAHGVLVESLVEGNSEVEWEAALTGAADLFINARAALEDVAEADRKNVDWATEIEQRGYNRGQKAGRRAELEGRVPDQGSGGEPAPSTNGTGDSVDSHGCTPQELDPEPADRFEVFVDPAHVAEPVEDRTCPVCGEVKDSIAGMRIHRGRVHKGQLLGLVDEEGETLTADVVATALEEARPPAEPAAVDEDAEDEANVGPCGPCQRRRCQFCSGHGCKCHQPDHFSRAPRAAAS